MKTILRRLLLCICLLGCFLPATFAAPPYPTAGGADGQVLYVTSLDDSGPGSLREALNAQGSRIIRFRVAGEIWLKDKLQFHSPFVTVEGDSAPSPGITLMGDKLRIRAHDVILRHLRVRVGALLTASDPQNRDGIEVDGAEDGSDPAYNVLVEHCSIAWAVDENFQVWGKNNHDIVLCDCILAEGLQNALHPKGGTHSAGMVVGPGVSRLLIQGNLFACNAFRNPVISAGTEAAVINNLVYNPGFAGMHFYGRTGEWADAKLRAALIGNVLIAGPNTRPSLSLFHQNGLNAGSQIYLKDNSAQGVKTFDESTRPPGWAADAPSPFVDTPPVPVPEGVKVLPSGEVEASVLARVGARPDDRDELDKRILAEVRERKGSQKDVPTDPRLCPHVPLPGGVWGEYAQLLKKYVTPTGIRYGQWKQNSEDMAALQRVVDAVAVSKEDDLAFFLNAYNAWMLHEVLKEYPVKNVNEPPLRFFEANRIKVAGRETSFAALEREMEGRFHDPRIVFALERSSRSGARLAPEPFIAAAVKTQLDLRTGLFINSDNGVTLRQGQTAVSQLFERFKDQFPKGARETINTFRHQHIPDDLPVVFQDYNGTLDEAP